MVIGYLRVSTDEQSTDSQKLSIQDYALKHSFGEIRWKDVSISSRKSLIDRLILELLAELKSGDMLIVAELSRLGRSLSQLIWIVQQLIDRKIDFVSVKEGIEVLKGKQSIQTKMLVGIFALLGEIERDLISERTKEGLARIKANGTRLGRRPGQVVASRADEHIEMIKTDLDARVAIAAIARKIKMSRSALTTYVKSRGLIAHSVD